MSLARICGAYISKLLHLPVLEDVRSPLIIFCNTVTLNTIIVMCFWFGRDGASSLTDGSILVQFAVWYDLVLYASSSGCYVN